MINRVETFLHNIDVVVLPSFREGLAMCLLEGMASGCALIATDVGASRELVKNEVNGLLIKKGSIEELYNAMKYIIENPEKVIEMKKKSVFFSKKFDLDRMFQEYQDLYVDIIHE